MMVKGECSLDVSAPHTIEARYIDQTQCAPLGREPLPCRSLKTIHAHDLQIAQRKDDRMEGLRRIHPRAPLNQDPTFKPHLIGEDQFIGRGYNLFPCLLGATVKLMVRVQVG